MSADLLRQAATILRERANAATPAPWSLVWDSCDCGDGYGCNHGSWVHAIRFPVPVQEPMRPGGEVLSHHYEGGTDELPPETVEYMVTLHPGVGLALAEWLIEEAVRVEVARGRGLDARIYEPALRAAELILAGGA